MVKNDADNNNNNKKNNNDNNDACLKNVSTR